MQLNPRIFIAHFNRVSSRVPNYLCAFPTVTVIALTHLGYAGLSYVLGCIFLIRIQPNGFYLNNQQPR